MDEYPETHPLYVPERPLRALPEGYGPLRKHLGTCRHNWVRVPSSEWNDAQRERGRCDVQAESYIYPEYTEECPGCDDLIAWRQFMRRTQRSKRA